MTKHNCRIGKVYLTDKAIEILKSEVTIGEGVFSRTYKGITIYAQALVGGKIPLCTYIQLLNLIQEI